jgi:hypothetical protein
VDLDHHELRSAFERFLGAKRALRHAYRRYVASQGPAEMRPVPEWGASEQAGNHPVMSERLQNLEDENGRLRKSLRLVHAHSLRLQAQLDTLLVQKDKLLGACEAVVSRMREDVPAEGDPAALAGPLDDALREYADII